MDLHIKPTRYQPLSSVSSPQINTNSFSHLLSEESNLGTNETDIPLLMDYKSGAKLYKRLVHFNKKMLNQDFYYPEHLQIDNQNSLDILYCGQNNQIPRIFIINKKNVLGQGSQGIVYLAQEIFKDKNRQDNAMVAIKVFKINISQRKQDFNNEVKLLSLQNRCHGSMRDSKNSMGYLIQDFCYGKSFFDWCYKKIGYNEKINQNIYERIPMSFLLKKRFINAILQAYHELHQKYGILHRDIKPDNIMISVTPQGQIIVKIIDFATSCLMQEADKNFSGTPGYLPPEALNDYSNRPYTNMQTEYWSIGVMCGALLSENNYLEYLHKKMAFAQEHTGFIPNCEQKDLYKSLPDVFNKKKEPNLPLLRRNQHSTSSSSSSPFPTLSWDDYLFQCIFWLTRENVNLRPGPQEVTRVIENLLQYEKNDNLQNENIDPVLIENICIEPNKKEIEMEIIDSEEPTLDEKKKSVSNQFKTKK